MIIVTFNFTPFQPISESGDTIEVEGSEDVESETDEDEANVNKGYVAQEEHPSGDAHKDGDENQERKIRYIKESEYQDGPPPKKLNFLDALADAILNQDLSKLGAFYREMEDPENKEVGRHYIPLGQKEQPKRKEDTLTNANHTSGDESESGDDVEFDRGDDVESETDEEEANVKTRKVTQEEDPFGDEPEDGDPGESNGVRQKQRADNGKGNCNDKREDGNGKPTFLEAMAAMLIHHDPSKFVALYTAHKGAEGQSLDQAINTAEDKMDHEYDESLKVPNKEEVHKSNYDLIEETDQNTLHLVEMEFPMGIGVFIVPDEEERVPLELEDNLDISDESGETEEDKIKQLEMVQSEGTDWETDLSDEEEYESALDEPTWMEMEIASPIRTTSTESGKSVISTIVIPKGKGGGGKKTKKKDEEEDEYADDDSDEDPILVSLTKAKKTKTKKRKAKFSNEDNTDDERDEVKRTPKKMAKTESPKKKEKKKHKRKETDDDISKGRKSGEDSEDNDSKEVKNTPTKMGKEDTYKKKKKVRENQESRTTDDDGNVSDARMSGGHHEEDESSKQKKTPKRKSNKEPKEDLPKKKKKKERNVSKEKDEDENDSEGSEEFVTEAKFLWLPRDHQDYEEARTFDLQTKIAKDNYTKIFKKCLKRQKDNINNKMAHIVNPHQSTTVISEDVNPNEIKAVVRMDGYKWRDKGQQQNKDDQRFKLFYFYSETEVATVTTNRLTKRVLYDNDTKILIQQYLGDLRYATPAKDTLAEVPLDEWPDHQLCPHPKDVAGTKKMKDKYIKFYESQDGTLKLVPSIAKGQLRTPPPSPDRDDDGTQSDFNVVSQELKELQKRWREIRTKRKDDPLDSTDDEQDDLVDPNRTSESKELRKATRGYNSNVDIKIGLEELYNLKEVANQMDVKWKAEGRGSFWEDSSTHLIVDPQPNDFFFRDFSKITHQVEKHESIDIYGWKKHVPHFVDQTFCQVHKQNYTFKNQRTGKSDDRWTKTVYIFPKDAKAIIHYKGDNSEAIVAPHGNSIYNTVPHRPRLPEVNTLAQDILDKHPAMTSGELYKELSQVVGAGMVGILGNPRNRRSMKYQKQKHDRMMDDMVHANIRLAEEEAGGANTIVRRLDVHTPDAAIMVLVDDLMVEEVRVCILNKTTIPHC